MATIQATLQMTFTYDVRDVFRENGFDGGRLPLARAVVSVAKDKIEADRVLPIGYKVFIEDTGTTAHLVLTDRNRGQVHYSNVFSEDYLNNLASYLHQRVITPAELFPTHRFKQTG